MGKQEAALIAAIQRRFPSFSLGLGIGDDAAILESPGRLAITSDMLVEDVDFTATIPIGFVAEKSLSVNLSDLAAMGAVPAAFLLTLGIPRPRLGDMETFLDALAVHAARHRIELIGGDLSAAEKLIIAITAIGRQESHALLRGGARSGDRVYVSRPVGASAAGLELLQRGWQISSDGAVNAPEGMERAVGYAQREFAASVIRRHVSPEPEVSLGIELAALGGITSCIDLSDGLSSDLRHLCTASGKGATVEWERVPAFPDLLTMGRTLGIQSERAVLHGGEDYALLFTSSSRESDLSTRLGRPVYAIGRITEGPDILLERDGKTMPLPDEGYDHWGGT